MKIWVLHFYAFKLNIRQNTLSGQLNLISIISLTAFMQNIQASAHIFSYPANKYVSKSNYRNTSYYSNCN